LIGIVIIISLSLFIDPFLNDVLSKNKKNTNSKISNDQSKSSNLKTDCKVGIQTSNSCNNTIYIINVGNKDKPISTQGQQIIGLNNTGQEINNTINVNTNKTLPLNSTEPINPPGINHLPSSSVSNNCEVPGPNMTFINSCSNK
jgi:hypothetical protein